MQRAASFVGAVAFLRQLERVAAPPEWRTRNHVICVVEEIAKLAHEDCRGAPFSPEEAECFRYLGLQPLSVGRLGRGDDVLK
jgi:hypothetical protein